MPAEFVPHEAIPELADRVTPEMLKVLRHIQREGFIANGSRLDEQTTAILQTLSDLGLVDPGYDGPTDGKPQIWVSNGNGSRVLSYKTGLRSGPHYEIPAVELASWLEQQGADRWWNVDGDPLLTGRLTFPCPADELAEELRRVHRPLLVQAKNDDRGAVGQRIDAAKLNEVVGHLDENVQLLVPGQTPGWGRDRLLYLCWKGSPYDWLLAEDSETTEEMRAAAGATAADAAQGKKQ